MLKLYLNWFDLVIIAYLLVSIWRGLKDGFVTQFLSYTAFFGGLFLGGWLFPRLLPIHDKTLLTVVNANLVLLTAIILAFAGFEVGRNLHYSFKKGYLDGLERYLGVALSLAAGLVIVWLVGSMLGRLPFEGISNSANDSLIEQSLVQSLPPVPAVFAKFDHQLNPNSAPVVFIKTKFQTQKVMPANSPVVKHVASLAEKSVVRVTSFGCGGIVSGSGFVAAPDLILTSAHVVAGVHRPIIKYGNKSYAATPVLFDSNLDLAALRVIGLKAAPLILSDAKLANNTPVIILGYPGGDYTVVPGAILGEPVLASPNIYGIDLIDRLTYELQTNLAAGNSGGPMISLDGRVAGIVFGKANSSAGVSYGLALPSASLSDELQTAMQSIRRVSTGACLAG